MIDELTKARIEVQVARLKVLACQTAIEFHNRAAIAVNGDGDIVVFIDNQPVLWAAQSRRRGVSEMLGITLQGLDKVNDKLDAMRGKLRHVRSIDIPHELGNWEVEDVHRHKPGLPRIRTGARTRFRPHSKYEMRRHRLAVKHLAKKGITHAPSTRPILREQMITLLRERMVTMLKEKIRW